MEDGGLGKLPSPIYSLGFLNIITCIKESRIGQFIGSAVPAIDRIRPEVAQTDMKQFLLIR